MNDLIVLHRSFTSTFRDVVRGELKMENLWDNNRRFEFQCLRNHVLGYVNSAPCEVTWSSASKCFEERIDHTQLNAALLMLWLEFKGVVRYHDTFGRVMFREGLS